MTVSLREATRVWARIGLSSFGGPAGQIALMHRVLVQELGWISETRFLHALNFCMLLPGPEAQQLATYVGWYLHGVRGGLLAGGLFILPGACVILGLSYLYASAGSIAWVQGIFFGLKPAIVIIVLEALLRIGRRSLRSGLHVLIALAAFVAMFALSVPFPFVVLGSGVLGAVLFRGVRRPESETPEKAGSALSASLRAAVTFGALWLLPVAALIVALGMDDVYTKLAIFFSKMAVVTFGGAYAVLSYVSQEVVGGFGWLTAGEMIDGLALAETTPGPLILVLKFVGFVAAYRNPGELPAPLAGLLGSLLTLWVTFVPCFLWIFAGAPHLDRLRRNRALTGALSAVTAAVVGAIANLTLWFSIHTIFEQSHPVRLKLVSIELPIWESAQPLAVGIALVAALLLLGFRRSLLLTLAVCAALGVATRLL